MNKKLVKLICCFIPYKKARKNIRCKLLNEFGLGFPWRLYYKRKVENLCANDNRTQVFIAGSGAISEYAINTYKEMPDKFVIFANVKSIKELKYLRSLAPNIKNFIWPLYERFNFNPSIEKIFYLGNSMHYCNIFKTLINTKGIQNRYVVLADIVALGATGLGLDEIKNIILNYYPELKDKIDMFYPENMWQFLSTNNISLARWVIDVTGVNNLIVFSDKGYNFLTKELKSDKNNNICKLFMPIKKINLNNNTKILKHKHKYLIGTFGIPCNITKGTGKIIRAAKILNNRSNDIDLLLCGIGVEPYSHTISDKNNLYFVESPDTETFYNLMKQCDVIIQLRENYFTFASGCVMEALGLEKPVVITENMAEQDWNNLTVEVKEGVSAEELADKIEYAINNKIGNKVNIDLYDKYSFLNICKRIYDFVYDKEQ